jgi:hypothetical protein
MANILEQPNKKSQFPSLEELEAALPEELRGEFRELGEKLEKISLGAFYEVPGETQSEEEKEWEKRYEELEKIAKENLEKKEN